MHFDPNITMDDIKIERATPENLLKPYEDFETLLDKMMYVNRDVFKCKRWDFDYWLYDFVSDIITSKSSPCPIPFCQ